MSHDPKFESALQALRESSTREANKRLRQLFMDPATTDLALGATILANRKKGMQNLFILMQQWSPLMWLRTDEGFRFQINELDMRAMGKDALDPRIDAAVVESVKDKMLDTRDNDFMAELVRDAIMNQSPTLYKKVQNG